MGTGSRHLNKLPFSSSSSSSLFLLVVVAVFCIMISSCCQSVYGQIMYDRVHIYAFNDLDPVTTLTIHCKSKDDDLGEHTLTIGQNFQWSFHPNLFETTLFWCSMWWHDSNGKLVQASHEVYRVNREWYKCATRCYWSIRKDGWYEGPSRGDVHLRYPWQ
ncbi:Plant self-incompatibility S1 [Macleaya cordata]|uniref:S-protein homolog n=1 Tax=Macleaya cordata TaxID=56857 RepID=A0A200R734_MACCD|nr:Plant self-incompatibility S1 [Macleaya cordata]